MKRNQYKSKKLEGIEIKEAPKREIGTPNIEIEGKDAQN